MARYDKGERHNESLPYQGDHAQDVGSQGTEDDGQHVQHVRGGAKVRQHQGGGRGGGRGARPGGRYRGGVRGQGQAKGTRTTEVQETTTMGTEASLTKDEGITPIEGDTEMVTEVL